MTSKSPIPTKRFQDVNTIEITKCAIHIADALRKSGDNSIDARAVSLCTALVLAFLDIDIRELSLSKLRETTLFIGRIYDEFAENVKQQCEEFINRCE